MARYSRAIAGLRNAVPMMGLFPIEASACSATDLGKDSLSRVLPGESRYFGDAGWEQVKTGLFQFTKAA